MRELTEEGFFTEPRYLSELPPVIRDRYAHTVESNVLSPVMARLVRDKLLTRAKDDDGVYRYTSA